MKIASRRINKKWQGIIESLVIDNIPFNYIDNITIILKDGSKIEVANEDEFIEAVSILRQDSDIDPIDNVAFKLNYNKLKNNVENGVQVLFDQIFKNKTKKSSKNKKRK